MVKKEDSHIAILTIEGWHGFTPLGEVINDHNDVFMVIDQRRFTGHEVDCPIIEGTDSDVRM